MTDIVMPPWQKVASGWANHNGSSSQNSGSFTVTKVMAAAVPPYVAGAAGMEGVYGSSMA
jgi:hypothetical protein